MDEILTLPRRTTRMMDSVPSAALLHNGLNNGAHALPFWMQLAHKQKPSKANTRSFLEVLAEEQRHNEPPPAHKVGDARNIAAYYMELSAP